MSTARRTAVIATLALACTTAVAGLSSSAEGAGVAATSYRVQGIQTPVANAPGMYTMQSDAGHAGLVGDWATTMTASHVSSPWYFEIGTEKFKGCLDRNGDNSCKNDPAGSMSFTYAAWIKFDPITYAELSGGCVHPITGGTGAFQGARGLLTMRDTARADGSILTTYRGTVTLSARAGTSAASDLDAPTPPAPMPESAASPAVTAPHLQLRAC